jgi:hypothetical protein
MNRLMQRLAQLEQIILPRRQSDRDLRRHPFRGHRARIDRCLTEVGRSPKDMIIVLRDFSDPDEIGPREPRRDPPWRVDQLPA